MSRPRADQRIMSFGEHLDELRRRLILALVGLVPILILGLVVGRPTLALLLEPAQRSLREAGLAPYLQQTSPMETFGAYMKVSIILAVLVGSPWLIYQLWLFVAPGLYSNEKRFVRFLLPFSALLTAVGVAFMYYVILPLVLTFFIGFGSTLGDMPITRAAPPPGVVFPRAPILDADPISPAPGDFWVNRDLNELRFALPAARSAAEGAPQRPEEPAGAQGAVVVLGAPLIGSEVVAQQYRVTEYLSMVLSLALAFGVAFQTPIVVLLLGWVGLVEESFLRRHRKHVLFICAILGAVLTPADPFSMVLLMVPLYGLYELGLLMLHFLPASRIAGKKRAEDDHA